MHIDGPAILDRFSYDELLYDRIVDARKCA
jgi:hypothetical protein